MLLLKGCIITGGGIMMLCRVAVVIFYLVCSVYVGGYKVWFIVLYINVGVRYGLIGFVMKVFIQVMLNSDNDSFGG